MSTVEPAVLEQATPKTRVDSDNFGCADLPEHVLQAIEEGERQLDAGLGIPHEKFMAEWDKWLEED